MKNSNNKGSILVLTIFAVLILTVSVIGVLNIGQTDQFTSQNYTMGKKSYYHSVQGQEEVTETIRTHYDPHQINVCTPFEEEGPISKRYATNSLATFQSSGAGKAIVEHTGFNAPQAVGIRLGPDIVPMVYELPIVSESKAGNRQAYTEIVSGIYKILAQ